MPLKRRYAERGSLRAHLISHFDLCAEAIHAQIGELEPWVFRPFEIEEPTSIFALDERRLLVVGDRRSLATFDIARRAKLVEAALPRHVLTAKFLVSNDGAHLLSYNEPWQLICTSTLQIVREYRDAPSAQEAVELADGSFILLCQSPSRSVTQVVIAQPDGALRTISTGAVDATRVERPSHEHLSPCGRWILRFHAGSVSMRGAVPVNRPSFAGRFLRLLKRESGAPAYTVQQILEARIDLYVELWSIEPFAFVRRIRVGEFAIDQLTQQKSTAEGPFAARRRAQIDQEILLAQEDKSLLKELSDKWNAFNDADRAYLWGGEVLFAYSRAAEALAFDNWRPEGRPVSAYLPPEMQERRWLDYMPRLISRIKWSSDGNSFWAVHQGGMAHHLDLEGHQITVEPWRDRNWVRAPEALAQQARSYLEDLFETTIPLAGLDEASCSRAVDELTDLLAKDFADLVHKGRGMDVLRLRFELPDRIMLEPDFFAHLVEHCPSAATSLRSMWQTFNNLAKTEKWSTLHTYYDEQTGLLGHAALALARIDPRAYEVLEIWFALRDIGHEPFGGLFVLPAIAETCGWSTPEAVAFGLRTIVGEEREGTSGITAEVARGLMQAARNLFTPKGFVNEINAAAQAYSHRNGDDALLDIQADLVRAVCPPQGSTNVWDRRLRKELGFDS